MARVGVRGRRKDADAEPQLIDAMPGGRKLVTLEDAGNYITKLPEAEHSAPDWQDAMEALILWSRREADQRCWRGSASCERCTATMHGLSIPIGKTRIGESGS